MPPLRVASPKLREEDSQYIDDEHQFLEKFWLYETRQRFYLLGSDKIKKHWRVLKIDRSEPFELNISEDPIAYTQQERNDLLQRIKDGNRSTGGLNFVTKAFGIAGCVRFLASYYLILITKRRQVGTVCDHAIHGIEESQILAIPHLTVQTEVANSKAELRYKKLLSSVDLTKDFFFSCTYPIMQSLQRNMLVDEDERMPYENLFVWNSFLTCTIRKTLNNSRWTVALIHGSFEQVKMSIFGRVFSITLIARRSRHFAGTRYLKRGVNDKGRVANDVETEQIITKEESAISRWEVASVVQMRGSIPLFWSQEVSRLSPKPDIILQRYDPTYQATRSHFEDLERRYGNPVIVLNLIKTVEKRPREMMLRREFANAVGYLNQTLPEGSQLQFIHWDFHKFAKSKSANVLAVLGGVANQALDLTGFYYSGKSSVLKSHMRQRNYASSTRENRSSAESVEGYSHKMKSSEVEHEFEEGFKYNNKEVKSKESRYQSGVLRTNCIDCLDRTNVAQYAYGLAALGLQLFSLGLTDVMKVEPESSIAGALMDMYQNMGDALALQYGGSAAHNSDFPERHGKWRAATQSQEFLKSIKRYYSNTYTDGEKQDAMNLFLGYFQPEESKPALWELDSDYYLHVGNGDNSHASDAWSLLQVSESVTALRRIENALQLKSKSQQLKLTSFDKLLEATCGSLKNVRMCSESNVRSKLAAKSSQTAPDAAEAQLKSPNWLFRHCKQELKADKPPPANALPIVKKRPEVFDNKDLNRVLGLETFRETEIFERYLKMATTEDDSWYGCGLLLGSVEDSEANRHYAQLCQTRNLDPFHPTTEEDGGCIYVSENAIQETEDENVLLEIQSALNEYKDIEKDLGSIASMSRYDDTDVLTHYILGREEPCTTL